MYSFKSAGTCGVLEYFRRRASRKSESLNLFMSLFILYLFILLNHSQSYSEFLNWAKKSGKICKRGCCNKFKGKRLIINEISKNEPRKKWLRGTG